MSDIDIRRLLLAQYENALSRAWQRQDLPAAAAAAQALLQVRIEALGPDHPEVANALYELAEAERLQREHARAVLTLGRALAIEQAHFGERHERYAEALHRLGHVHLQAGAVDDAARCFADALRVLEATLADDDPRLAIALGSLATTRRLLGAHAEAAELLERALQSFALAHGPEAEQMCAPLEELALTQEARGALEDAMRLRQRCIRILTRIGSPALAPAWSELARTALDAGAFAPAEEAAREAVRMQPEASTARARAQEILGEVLERRVRLVEAREQYRQALDTYERQLPHHHPQVGVAQMNVATLELRLGEVDRAARLAEHALRVFLDAFGPTHPHTQAMREAVRRLFQGGGHADQWDALASVIPART